MARHCLPFERPIYEMEDLLAQLEAQAEQTGSEKIRNIRREIVELKKSIFKNLTPWQTIEVARHQERPHTVDYVELMFDEFVELHGDQGFGDDRAIRTGFARLGDFRVMLIGQEKGRTTQERTACFWGCAHPEGYRKALRCMKLAAKF